MSYMRDNAGKRLDQFVVPDRYDTDPPWEPPIAPVPSPAVIPENTVEYLDGSGGTKRWGWMSKDGLRLYNYEDTIVRVSYDATSTLSLSTAFARSCTLTRETGDGELITCVKAGATAPGDPPGEVWKSTGYNAAAHTVPTSWTKVLTLSDGGAWIDRFSHAASEDQTLFFLMEYGLKGTTYAAKKAYVSADSGSTWHVIFTHPQPDPTNAHGHGIRYDKYWDAVWITTGDGAANRGIWISFDWREALTGGTPTFTKITGSDSTQVTAIYPLRDCILFLSDNAPNGVMRYRRTGYRTVGALETAHLITELGNNQYVGNMAYRRSDDDPLLMTFTPSLDPPLQSKLVATWDGETFYDLWTEARIYDLSTSQGLVTAFGPFGASKKIVGNLRDDQRTYTIFRAPMPTWQKIPTTPQADGTTFKLKIDDDGVFYTEAPDGTQTYPGSSATVADGSITPAKLSFVNNAPRPGDQGLISWSMDPGIVSSQTAPNAAGTAHVVRLRVDVATTITNIFLRVGVAGSGLTSGQCFAALYQGGNLLAQTADQSTAWALTGTKTMPLSTPQAVAAGFVDVLFWANGTTLPQFIRGSTLADFTNVGGAATPRFSRANTGLTTTAPASIGARTNDTAFAVAVN